jgi:hypothetical protein
MSSRSDPAASDRELARSTLEGRGIPFDEQRALDYVRKGDASTVELMLAAGLDPNVSDAEGVPALVLAARRRHQNICRILIAHGADPGVLVDELPAFSKSTKDAWERLASLGGVLTFVSSLVVAAVGWHFTNAYNERQQTNAAQQAERDAEIRRQQTRISEMDTVVKMIPHLTQGEQSKKAALLALSALATPELAVQMAQLFGGVGSVQALQTIATQSPTGTESGAVSALAGIASRPAAGGEGEAASAASAALVGIFTGKERALVTVLHGGAFTCNGFVAQAKEPIVVTPAYCVTDAKAQDLALRLWDQTQIRVRVVSTQGAVAMLAADELTKTLPLPLVDSVPAIGSRVLKIAYGMSLTGAAPSGSPNLSVATGTVVGTGTIASFGAGRPRHEILRVRFPTEKGSHSGEGGGPILDASGAAVCMVYAGAADSGLEQCLPSAAIRQALATSSQR